MGKKILSGIIATALTASTVATSVIPMTNYKPHNENLVANTTDVVETNNVSLNNKFSHMNYERGIPSEFTFKTIADGGWLGIIGWWDNFTLYKDRYYIIEKQHAQSSETSSWWKSVTDCNVKFEQEWADSQYNQNIEYLNSLTWVIVTPKMNIDSRDHENLMGSEIVVYEPVFKDGIKPTITGTNNFIVNVNNMLSKEEILSHITARDETDGPVPVVIESSTYNPSNKKTGDYEMVVSASDKAGNKTSVTIKVKVVDIDKPVINGTTSYTRSYDNPISIEDIKAGASDKAGNKTSVTIKVKVVDIDKPVINGTTSYTRSYDNPISIEDIKAGLSVSDNYDSGLQLELIQDNYSSNTNKVGVHTVTFKAKDSSNNESDVCTVSITVEDKIKPVELIQDNYSSNTNKVGVHTVTFKAKDSSNNESDVCTVSITVEDKIKPVISGPTTIKVPSNKVLNKEEFKKKYTINDGLDGEITLVDGMITGFDTYLQNFKKVGNYKVTINSSDKNGNLASLEVTIKVEDKIDPEIWFDDYFIVLEEGQSLTPEQIKEYASKVLGVSLDAITEVTGEYDTNVAGTYKLSVKTVDGKEHVINLSVTEKVVENTREMKWYEYIYEWFLILFNIEPEYKTDSFWNFGTRWQSMVKVYTEHKILDNKLIK